MSHSWNPPKEKWTEQDLEDIAKASKIMEGYGHTPDTPFVSKSGGPVEVDGGKSLKLVWHIFTQISLTCKKCGIILHYQLCLQENDEWNYVVKLGTFREHYLEDQPLPLIKNRECVENAYIQEV